jgi:NADH-quinone oxidoreductase chain G
MITITINGREIRLERPVTVLEAARKAGIRIPTLCNHELLRPFGGCRLCVVEVEKMPKLMTSCTLMAADGMVVRTESDIIRRARRSILEFLLINHPLDCPVCDKAGECELQDATMMYGPPVSRFQEEKRKVPESHDDPVFARNMERCISCTRCVRMCADVQGASAITMVSRGGRTRMEPFSGRSFDCEYCGNCMLACPVGSILSREYIYSYRPWQMDREVRTICGYCGVGCTLLLHIRDEAIKRVWSRPGLGVNNGILCSKGMFGYGFLKAGDRLREPLIRKDGRLQPASWDEALDLVARRLLEVRDGSGGSAIAGIASPRCTNEDNYVFQKFMRLACRTNNIDSISRTGFAAAQGYLEGLLGQGITANIIGDIRGSDVVLVLGGDPTAINPVLGLEVREASRRGGKVVVIGHAPGLARFTTLRLTPPPFREADILNRLLLEVCKDRKDKVKGHPMEDGLSRLSTGGDLTLNGLDELRDMLLDCSNPSIILGMDLVQRTDGHSILFLIAGLTLLLGARLYLLSEGPNEQGLIDMGCVPDMLPGGRPIAEFKAWYEEAWGAQIPDGKGLTLMEIIDGARAGRIKALYVMGENPVFNLPNGKAIRDALGNLDLLVVQDIFMTETAEIADVVLPAIGWSEKEGTYTNLERRIQYLPKAVNNPAGMDDWMILSRVSGRMGCWMAYSSAGDIMDEIARVSPLHRGLTYDEIKAGDRLWPYKGEPFKGRSIEAMHIRPDGRGYNGRLYLCVDRPLFHSGTISQRSPILTRICPAPLLRLGQGEAQGLGINDGDDVIISTNVGEMRVRVKVDESIDNNVVFLSNHFKGKGVFSLMGYTLDPVTKAPGVEGCEVNIKKG